MAVGDVHPPDRIQLRANLAPVVSRRPRVIPGSVPMWGGVAETRGPLLVEVNLRVWTASPTRVFPGAKYGEDVGRENE